MKALLQHQARRLDALTLRERVIMFASIAAALVAAADFLVLSPTLATQKRLATQMQERTSELAGLRARVAAAAQGADDTPQGRLRTALLQVRAENSALETEITERVARSAQAARLADLLARVLKRHDRLTLVRLTTTAPPLVDEASGRLPLHTVTLSVGGSYHDLAGYIGEIERTLPGLRWSDLRVTHDGGGTLLTVRVQLLGDLP